MKTYPGYKRIFAGYQGAGRDVYVITSSFDTFEHIFKEYRTNYHMTSIMRKIASLNANPLQGQGINPAGDICTSKSGNISMQYSLHNGAVLINFMQIGKPKVNQSFGLYPVTYSETDKQWAPTEDPVSALNKSQQWKSKSEKAHYAAIAGRFDNMADAGHLLSQHVIGAYSKSDYLTSSDAKGDFSMFWSEKGKHKSPEVAQALASIMQQSSKSGLPVNWLVHDVGTDTFKAAAQILKAEPLATAKARASKENAGAVHSQNVYFSNPNTSSENALKKLCEEAGLGYVGLNTNNRDLRRFSTFKNVGTEMGKSVSLAVATGAGVNATLALKQMGAGGAEKIINNGFDALLNGNHLGVVAATVAAGFIAVGVAKKVKTISAGVHCTFGKGNQKWYTSDKELLA